MKHYLCDSCGAEGANPSPRSHALDLEWQTCPRCAGHCYESPKNPDEPCPLCDGEGQVPREDDDERSVANVLEDIHLVLCTQSKILNRIAGGVSNLYPDA